MATRPHGSAVSMSAVNGGSTSQYSLGDFRTFHNGHEKSSTSGTISTSSPISMSDAQGVRFKYQGFYSTTRTAYSTTVTWNNVSFGPARSDRMVVCIFKQDMGGTTTYVTSGTIGGYSASCAAMGNKLYTATSGLDTTGFNANDRQWRQCHILYRSLSSGTSGTVTTTTQYSDQYTNACLMWVWAVYGANNIRGFGASGFADIGWASGGSTSNTSSKGYTNAYSHMSSRNPGLILSVFGSERAGDVSGNPQRDWGLTNINAPSTTFQNNHRAISETSGSTSITSFGDEWTSGAGRHYYSQGNTATHHVAYNAQDRSRSNSSVPAWACADFT